MIFTETELATKILLQDKDYRADDGGLTYLALDILENAVTDLPEFNGWVGVGGYTIEYDPARRGSWLYVYGELWQPKSSSEKIE